jgi:4-amino-4-deoxy-L-arabinose transferase-like glycosyltransferase
VIAIFVLLGTVIAVKTPAYESADEPGHVENIESLVAGHWYGMNSKCEYANSYCTGTEAHQAPLYYLGMAAWQKLVGLPARPPYKGAETIDFTNRGLFLHHSAADHRFLLWLRLPNVLLGALTVLFTFFAVRLLTSDPWTPVVGASIVAFLPRFVFLTSFVTNDNLVTLLGAVLTVAALRFARSPSRWRMVAVGVCVGLLIITKLSALPVGLILVALVLMVTGWKRRTELFGIGVLSTVVVSGWYLIQNTVRYGDPLARAASARYLAQVGGLGTLFTPYKEGNPLSLVFVRVPDRILDTFWYQSGWNQFHWTWPTNLLFWLVLFGALAGLISGHVDRRALATLGTVVVTGLLSVWLVATQTSTYQARYAFVGLAALSTLAALGLERWCRPPIRFLLPVMGLCGTVIAIQQDVLAVHWW